MPHFGYHPGWSAICTFAVLAAGVVFWSYQRARGRASRGWKSFLAFLRWLAISLVLICLLDPQRIESITRAQKARFAVVLDTSRSMATTDAGTERLTAARQWLIDNLQSVKPENVEISYHSFSDRLTPPVDLHTLSPTGGVTAIAGALNELLVGSSETPLAGVLLVSDGIDTQSGSSESSARSFRRKGIAIHTLLCGTTNEPLDIVVENIQVRRAVPNESPTRIVLNVRSHGYMNRKVTVTIHRDSDIVAVKDVVLNGGAQRIEMDFIPRQKGFNIYQVSIAPQEGEWLSSNNRRSFGLEVIDPTIRVIYMEGTPQTSRSPMAEWKYLKDALESDPNIMVRTLYRQFGNNGRALNTVDSDPETGQRIYPVEHPTKGFPKTLKELLEYDVVIHSDIRKESFTDDQLKNIARLVEERGGGFVMIGGNSAFGRGGYHKTVLDRIIPVAMEGSTDTEARPLKLKVARTAWNHPIVNFGGSREVNQRIWGAKFPMFYGYNRVDRAKPGAIVLAEEDDGSTIPGEAAVLIAVQEIGRGRSMAFTSDTTRSWGRDFETEWGEPNNKSLPVMEGNCDSRYYKQFWVNAVRWLAAGKLGPTNAPVILELSQTYAHPGDPFRVVAKVRNALLQDVTTAEVDILAVAHERTNRLGPARYDPGSRAYVANLIAPAAGAYVMTAVAKLKGAELGEDRQLLVSEETDREAEDLRARPEVLAQISRLTGGISFDVSNVTPSSTHQLFASVPPPTVEHRRESLWDKPQWMALLLAIVIVEWGLRRWRGLA